MQSLLSHAKSAAYVIIIIIDVHAVALSVCVCVCACVRACMCACVYSIYAYKCSPDETHIRYCLKCDYSLVSWEWMVGFKQLCDISASPMQDSIQPTRMMIHKATHIVYLEYTDRQIYIQTQTYMHGHALVHAWTHIHTLKHTHTHNEKVTQTYTQTHTCMHAHTCKNNNMLTT